MDLPIVEMNLGTTSVVDSSRDGPAPSPSPSLWSEKLRRSLSRFTPAMLEAEESTIRKELTLDNLSSSIRARSPSPLSRSTSTKLVVDCLAPDQGRKEANPLNIGNGVVK